MCWYRDKWFWIGILLAWGSSRALYNSVKYAKNPLFSESNIWFILFIIFFVGLAYIRFQQCKD